MLDPCRVAVSGVRPGSKSGEKAAIFPDLHRSPLAQRNLPAFTTRPDLAWGKSSYRVSLHSLSVWPDCILSPSDVVGVAFALCLRVALYFVPRSITPPDPALRRLGLKRSLPAIARPAPTRPLDRLNFFSCFRLLALQAIASPRGIRAHRHLVHRHLDFYSSAVQPRSAP